ncbi:hypothetical protein [Kingella potus]|uniref:hypothetical protein n=1 Tax=Kingella potus TaxID=265175 RepID=UPI001FCFBC6A|nr:hypothetical protein [Kingella potus]UOP00392.1 hypothetical protein LVJ84_10970 [Kingella potus]
MPPERRTRSTTLIGSSDQTSLLLSVSHKPQNRVRRLGDTPYGRTRHGWDGISNPPILAGICFRRPAERCRMRVGSSLDLNPTNHCKCRSKF